MSLKTYRLQEDAVDQFTSRDTHQHHVGEQKLRFSLEHLGNPPVVLFETDEWAGIYVDGKLACQYERQLFRMELLEVLDALAPGWANTKTRNDRMDEEGLPQFLSTAMAQTI